MNLLLFGFKACGKTYFGQRLSEELKCPFIDTDRLIEEAHTRTTGEKHSCREIYMRFGSKKFRALESEILQKLYGLDGVIMAVGGGMVLQPENLKILQTLGQFIYLSVDKKTLKQRILCPPLPSYLDPQNPEASFEEMYAYRKPLYENIPAIPIHVSSYSDTEVLTFIKTSWTNP